MTEIELSVREVAYWIIFVVQIVLSATSYIPQIIKLLKVKDSKGVSLASWAVSLFDFASYQALLILDGAGWGLQTLNAVQICQIIAVIILVKKYDRVGAENDEGNSNNLCNNDAADSNN